MPKSNKAKTIGINMPVAMSDELESRANRMGIGTSKYCKIILKQWIDSGKKLTLQG